MQETQETRVWSLGQEDPEEEETATYSTILAWRIHGQLSLTGSSPWGHKKSDMTEHAHKQSRFHKGKAENAKKAYQLMTWSTLMMGGGGLHETVQTELRSEGLAEWKWVMKEV